MRERDDHGSPRSPEHRRAARRPRHLLADDDPLLDDGPEIVPRGDGAFSSFRYWWSAVSNGRFFTWWTALVTLPMAVTVLGVYPGVQRVEDIPVPFMVSALSWAIQVLLVLPGAWAERRLRFPVARAVLVVGVVAVVSSIRPVLNDALLGVFAPELVVGNVPARMVTNVVAGVLVLSLVAIAVDAVDSATGVNRRLRDALRALAGPDAAPDPDAAREDAMLAARSRIIHVAGSLRWRAGALLSGGDVDFDRVRAFSEEVRARSHELDTRADAAGVDDAPAPAPWVYLAPPPIGLVGVLYVLAAVPYGIRVMSIPVMVVSAVIVIGICVLGDLLVRRLARGRSARTRGVLIVTIGVAVGAVSSLVLLVQLDDPVAFVALPAMPLLTVLIAIATGALRRGTMEQQWLTQALAAYRGVAATTPRTPSELLRAAASVLHGEVQGRCVVFAASLEDEPATPEQTARFVAAVSRALDHAVVPQTPARDEDPFAALIAAWSHVLQIDCEIEDAAATALRDRTSAREVADVVSEAFVNAVKHSAAREATVELRRTGSPQHPSLAVEVAAPGRLRDPRTVPGRALSQLPGHPRLTQRGTDVVLSAAVPLPAS